MKVYKDLFSLAMAVILMNSCNDDPVAIEKVMTQVKGGLVTNEIAAQSDKLIDLKYLGDTVISHSSWHPTSFSKKTKGVLTDSNGVRLVLNNSDTLVFKNRLNPEEETTEETNECLGEDGEKKFYLIRKQLYDTEKFFLVDRNTGKSTEIWNVPLANGNVSFLFSPQNSCFREFDDCPMGFQIWHSKNSEIFLYLQIVLKTHYVLNGVWTSSKELIIDVVNSESSIQEQNDTISAERYLIKLRDTQ